MMATERTHWLQIREGEMRLQYARQWGIPYPRLEHKDQVKSTWRQPWHSSKQHRHSCHS